MKEKSKNIASHEDDNIQVITDNTREPGIKDSNGITILEALSATGLRSIRYAKEIPGIKEIIANDISPRALNDIKLNVLSNQVEDLVLPSQSDAV